MTEQKEPKQVIVARTDLKMRKGKLAAQCAHASLKAVLEHAVVERTDKYPKKVQFEIDDEAQLLWFKGPFVKIVVGVNSEKELLEIYQKALDEGLPTALITDAGRTEFKGVPTNTCVAIGPAWPDDIDKITGELKLL